MTAAARRRQLQQYIDKADGKKIKSIFECVEATLERVAASPYNKWDDPDFLGTIDRRTKALEDGTDKGL
jgi:hypothetical protein